MFHHGALPLLRVMCPRQLVLSSWWLISGLQAANDLGDDGDVNGNRGFVGTRCDFLQVIPYEIGVASSRRLKATSRRLDTGPFDCGGASVPPCYSRQDAGPDIMTCRHAPARNRRNHSAYKTLFH